MRQTAASEAARPDGDEFGEQQLIDLLTASRELSACALQDLVMKAVTRFCGGEFQDDATLIALSTD